MTEDFCSKRHINMHALSLKSRQSQSNQLAHLSRLVSRHNNRLSLESLINSLMTRTNAIPQIPVHAVETKRGVISGD